MTAVSKWLNGTATPTAELQTQIERCVRIPPSWWRDVAPTDDRELLAMAWLLGLALPDAHARTAIEKAFGVSAGDWERPAV